RSDVEGALQVRLPSSGSIVPRMDPIRRKMITTGAAATAMAAAPRALAQSGSPAASKFYERGKVRIHYEEQGTGFPLMLIAGGGLDASIELLRRGDPFDPFVEFSSEFRCIGADLRNANGGQSSGPL